MVTVTLSRRDIEVISKALKRDALASMRSALKGRQLVSLIRHAPPRRGYTTRALMERIKAKEDYCAYVMALKEGTFDKILENTREVEG